MLMAGKITRAEIIESLYQKTSINRKDIHALIDLLIDDIKNALVNDEVVELRGFGTFEVRTRKGRTRARNPKTGELVSVQDHGVAVFRPGKELKKVVWNIRHEGEEGSEKDDED
jgi:nucleoid DNA-binding protein